MAEQMIFKRTEMKYMLTRAQCERLKILMEKYMKIDRHGRSVIQSLYYDTDSYLLIRRSMEHPLYKEKLRIRSYGIADENSKVYVELKKKYNSVVYKRRMEIKEGELLDFQESKRMKETQIGREIVYCFSNYENLSPAVLISCEREAFYGKEDCEFRMTFDENILWRDYDLDLKKGIYGREILGKNQVLLEVKSSGAIPKWLIDFMSEEHIYKTSFSKYANAYQSLKKAQ